MRRAIAVLLVLVACAAPSPSATGTPVARSSVDATRSARASAAATPTAGAATWEVLDDAPFARLEMAVTAHDGRIWLAGGLSPLGGALTDVDVFDPATGEWSEGPSLPTGVHHAALVSDGDRLLLMGGYLDADFRLPTEIVLQLPAGADGWVEGPALPDAIAAGAAAFDGSRVIYAGGFGQENLSSDVLALEGDSWERIGALAIARHHLAAASDGSGTVWLMGGRIRGLDENLGIVERLTDDDIAQIAELPTPRGGVAAFHAETVGACLTGGEAPDQAYRTVECVAADGTISTLPPLNEPHHGHGAAVVDGVAYVLLGGPQPRLSASSTVESLAVR
jgi:non-specific serine/threonine protein kinase